MKQLLGRPVCHPAAGLQSSTPSPSLWGAHPRGTACAARCRHLLSSRSQPGTWRSWGPQHPCWAQTQELVIVYIKGTASNRCL